LTAEFRDEGRSGTGGAEETPEVAVVAVVGVAAVVVVAGVLIAAGAGIDAVGGGGGKSQHVKAEKTAVAPTTRSKKKQWR
jgi:predicted metalloprotease